MNLRTLDSFTPHEKKAETIQNHKQCIENMPKGNRNIRTARQETYKSIGRFLFFFQFNAFT